MTFQLPPDDHPVWQDVPTRPFQLALQGGGFRGMFTCGVLDFFLDHGLLAESVVGVSMGAICGYSYASGTPGQTVKMALAYRDDPRFMSVASLLLTGSFVGNRFIFDTIPNKIEHVPTSWFDDSPVSLTTVATNVDTGRPDYHVLGKDGSAQTHERNTRYVVASSSLPYVSRMVEVDGKRLLDGGPVESIPYAVGLDRYRGRQVVVLTRERGYVRQEGRSSRAAAARYASTPALRRRLMEHVPEYNRELREVERLHDVGDVFAIWPDEPIDVSVYEKDPTALLTAYEQGLAVAAEQWPALLAYLGITV